MVTAFNRLVRYAGLVLAIFSVHCQAQGLDTNAAHFKVNRFESVWRVNADATSTLEAYVEREALSDSGAQAIGKFSQFVNSSLQTFEILEAYTLKADGRKIPVQKDGVLVQNGLATGGTGASWPDVQIHQVTFSDLQKGDKSVWRMRTSTHTPQLPQWASYADLGLPNTVYDLITIKIEAPQGLRLNVFSSGWKQERTQSGQNEVWQFEFRQPVSRIPDSNPANTLVSYPRIYASTLKTPAELVAAYGKQANAKAVVTDEVRALSNQITAGQETPQAKAAAIHDWVRKNVRYVAVYLGTGGWVPHDVDWILSKRYGDCKDHVLLTQTLLKAAGIEAVPVLINTTNEYAFTELPIGFNHCILYIPSLNMFADPTDSRIPFGSLPWADSDKPVAVALASGATTMRTPAFSADTNRITVRTKLSVDSTGKATGNVAISASGFAATTLQDRVDQIPAGMGGLAVQKILESSRWQGRGFAKYSKVQREFQQQSIEITDLEIDNLLADPQGGALNPHPALNLPMYILSNMGNHTAAHRELAYTCTPLSAREEFELTFDPAFALLKIPEDLKVALANEVAFEAHYLREGNRLTGWREITISQPRHICSSADYAARKGIMNRIARNLRSTVLYHLAH